ncbi:MAG: tetratricopeptide repeat protein, partial [Waddliaceae bacterium]
YKLPKMYQFWVKNAFYKIVGDWQNAAENARLFVTLYPQDPQGSYELAYHYGRMNRPDLAIAEYQRILELDPGSHFNLRNIGDLFKEKGEYEQALKYYEYYAEIYPHESRSFTAIGDVYRSIGEHEQANAYYKKARLIEPESVPILLDLAGIEVRMGNFVEAEQRYQSALKLAKTPQDRAPVHHALSGYHKFRGRIAQAIEHYNLFISELETYASPLDLLLARSDVFGTIELYILAGQPDKAWKVAKDFEAQAQQLVSPWNKAAPYLYIWYYVWLGDPENADALRENVGDIEAFLRETDMGFVRPYMRFARGIIHEFRNEYSLAIMEYEQALSEMEPPNYYKSFVRTFIGKWYRKLNEFKKAEEALQKALILYRAFPKAHYELALVYHEIGKHEKSLEHLKTALKVWEDADPQYRPAKKAKEKLEETQLITGRM